MDSYVVAGSPVLTPSGYRPIEEIAIGDEVVSADGNVCQVEAVGHKEMPVGRLKVLGRPEVVCTASHPFLCATMEKDNRKRSPTSGQLRAVGSLSFVEAEKSHGLYVCHGVWKEIKRQTIPQIDGLTERDVIELAGWYVGDGYIHSKHKYNYVVLCLVCEEKINQFKKTFPTISKSIDSRNRVYVYRGDLGSWLVENFGEKSQGKKLPYWLYTSKYKDAFLDGYFATDGYKRTRHGDSLSFSSASYKLAYGLADIFGNSSVCVHVPKKTHVIEGRIVNQSKSYLTDIWTGSRAKQRKAFNRLVSKVRSWTPLEELQTVYNITVKEDRTYVVAGFSAAGLRKGIVAVEKGEV